MIICCTEDSNNNDSYLFSSNYHTITLERSPQLGFCITENEIVSGTLSITSDGASFQGTKAESSTSNDDSCLLTSITHPCMTGAAFGPIEIDQNQLDEIQNIVVQIPQWQCDYDGACDPCILTTITVDDIQGRDTTCCNNSDENYRAAFNSLVDYLDNLLN